ncbi:ATPase [Maribellus maritimus]|uniref:ATPase n=1 Tax=Maribellus maritimus TaxID=2870838 RepID=UPI001EECE72C|nr:ATPase [Maribellus maritimus]MCG6190311.1 ATPase [Maribellus maritimus]
MILIADSGSTKTKWCFISDKNKTEFLLTNGINPYFRTTEDIVKELKQELLPNLSGRVRSIHFYGAGIVNPEVAKVVEDALKVLFPGATIETNSDLFAAARATLQNKKGFACILGTGSNSCLYDGEKIVEHVPPLGFILGDEGGGVVLGRKILSDFLKGLMPEVLTEKFRQSYPFQYADYLQKVYKEERPNRFLASFVPFIHQNIQNGYCKKLVEKSFEEFLIRNVFQYSGFQIHPVCFIGSVAFYFEDILRAVLLKNELNSGIILQEPMEGLIKFHTKN